MKRLLRQQSAIAIIVLAAFTGFLFASDTPGKAPQEKSEKAGLQTQSMKADPFTPKSMGGNSRPEAEKVGKRPIWPWLVAGAVVLGVAAYFLFLKPDHSDDDGSDGLQKRDVTLQSTPTGAAVFLDGQPTGLSTNCVLKGVSAGTHTIRMEKDGYRDYEAAYDVPANPKLPALLDVRLERGVITVSSPAAGAIQETGQRLPIRWSVDFQALAAASPEIGALGLPNIRIELWKNGAKVADIAANAPNNGAYDWAVPAGQATGEGFSVRVVCPSDATISGDSPAFIIAARTTRVYEGKTPAHGSYPLTCSFDAPIDVPDEGKIIAFRYRMSCYNETGVDIRMVAPDGTRLTNPSYEFKDFVGTTVFDGHEMKGSWRLEVRDTLTPPVRDDVTNWFGWAIEITYLDW